MPGQVPTRTALRKTKPAFTRSSSTTRSTTTARGTMMATKEPGAPLRWTKMATMSSVKMNGAIVTQVGKVLPFAVTYLNNGIIR